MCLSKKFDKDQRLSDDESKQRGYGSTCAANYGIP